MEDMDLDTLRQLKDQLMKEKHVLENDLRRQKARLATNYSKFITSFSKDRHNISITKTKTFGKQAERKHGRKLYQISCRAIGLSFENTDKKWLQEDVCLYRANVLTESMNFLLQLKVKMKDQKHTQVLDITCTFVGPTESYMLEISPWVKKFTKMKNFGSFITTVSNYNEQSLIRTKIVRTLTGSNYAYSEECEVEQGGILLHMHSQDATEEQLLTIQWSLVFVERKWDIEHFFTITPTDIGLDFVQENDDLLNNFCKLGLSREELVKLWSDLCAVLDDYEGPLEEEAALGV